MAWFEGWFSRFTCQGKAALFAIRLLGGIFILSALLKGLDATAFAVQISYFGLIRTPWLVKTLAILIVGVEAALGGMLLFKIGLRRVTLPATLGVLAAFSALLAWSWLFTDIKDCGCFGKFLKMTPGVSLLKNIFLAGLCLAGWRGTVSGLESTQAHRPSVLGRFSFFPLTSSTLASAGMAFSLMALALFTSQAELSPHSGAASPGAGSAGAGNAASNAGERKLAKHVMQWEGKRIDLGHGVYLVALLSDSCEHCAELVAELNRYGQDHQLPTIAGLILGEEDTYEQFKASFQPQFATLRIPVLEFFDLIGNAPPRFYLTAEGKPLKFWDERLPSAEEIRQAAAKAGIKFK
jgi:hypothetical protein